MIRCENNAELSFAADHSRLSFRRLFESTSFDDRTHESQFGEVHRVLGIYGCYHRRALKERSPAMSSSGVTVIGCGDMPTTTNFPVGTRLMDMKTCQKNCFSTLNHDLAYYDKDAHVIRWMWEHVKRLSGEG